MKRLALVIFIFIYTFLISGCSLTGLWDNETAPREQKPVELTLMHYYNDNGAIRWIDITTNVFTLTHANVAFNIMAVDSRDYIQLLRKKLASGDMPDIFMARHSAHLKEFIKAGYVADLTGLEFMNNLKDGLVNGSMLDGKVWCVPIETAAYGVTYNKDVFAKAGINRLPSTYEEFLEVCRAIKKVGIVPIGAAYANPEALRNDFNCDMVQSALKYDLNWMIDTEKGIKTWKSNSSGFKEALVRFGERSRYINSDCFDTDWDKATAMLADGMVGMILNGTSTIDTARYKNSMVNLGFFPFPWSGDPSQVKLPVYTTGGMAVNARSSNLDSAIEAVRFFTHQEVGNLFQSFRRTISPVKGLEVVADLRDVDSYIKNNMTVDISKYSPDFQEDLLNSLLDEVLLEYVRQGGIDADRYIGILDEETARILGSQK